MSSQLEKLAQYYQDKGNTPRSNLYAALAAEEQAIKGPESVGEQTTDTSDPVIEYLCNLIRQIAEEGPQKELSLLVQLSLFIRKDSQSWLAQQVHMAPEALSRMLNTSRGTRAATVLAIGSVLNVPLKVTHNLASKIHNKLP